MYCGYILSLAHYSGRFVCRAPGIHELFVSLARKHAHYQMYSITSRKIEIGVNVHMCVENRMVSLNRCALLASSCIGKRFVRAIHIHTYERTYFIALVFGVFRPLFETFILTVVSIPLPHAGVCSVRCYREHFIL